MAEITEKGNHTAGKGWNADATVQPQGDSLSPCIC